MPVVDANPGAISAFQGFEISDQVIDLVRLKAKLGHAGVARHDTFRQSFSQALDRVAGVQRAKGRRDREWAVLTTPQKFLCPGMVM
jgi:hypothetical protein